MDHRQLIKQTIRDIPGFPQKGVIFRDITPVTEDPAAFTAAISGLADLLADTRFDSLGAIESRGFIFATALAQKLGRKFVLLRKAGKLPLETFAASYELEYGQATLEVHRDSFTAGERVLLVDDLLATGGTALAAAELVRQAGATVAGYLFLVELEFLAGRPKLQDSAPVFSLVQY